MQARVAEESCRLRLEGISKRYPGCLANDDVDLAIAPGKIYALLGENGAGKSTLMKVIYGVVQPDAGRIVWEGEEIRIPAPVQARQLGIGMVFQHFSLFETLTVLENIVLAMDTREAADLDALAQKITEVSRRYGMELEPHRPVHTLSTGQRQRVEIVRCLIQDIKLLILDEPTSVLTPAEVFTLFATLRQLAQEGTSILFISHKLKEVQELCDHAVVLRAGRVTGACVPAQATTEAMARLMVGDETPVSAHYAAGHAQEDCLRIQGLSLTAPDPFGVDLDDIELTVKAGEIVGVAGVAGNGQSELLAALSGERLCSKAGAIQLAGVDIGLMPPGARRQQGLAVVPEDRLGQGAVPGMSLWENGLLTGFLQGLVSRGFLRPGAIEKFCETVIEDYGVKCGGPTAVASSLSGGNLQKFIIGREIQQNPICLVAAHPTWGVDVGAAIAIHKAIIQLRDAGAAILVISEDIDELFTVSDRICAVFDGALSPPMATRSSTIEAVGQAMAGVFAQEGTTVPPEHVPGGLA